MEVLEFIFLLALFSIGYGYNDNFLYCSNSNSGYTHSISNNKSATLIIYNDRSIRGRQCFWRFDSGVYHINLKEFRLYDSVNCELEYLKIGLSGITEDMTFCGKSYPTDLYFNITEGRYFDIEYASQTSSGAPALSIVISNSGEVTPTLTQLIVSKTPMYIYSPGYPENYYKNLQTTWMLTADDTKNRIMLEFLFFERQYCENNFIEVKGENTDYNTCGNKPKKLLALSDSSVNITFKTDNMRKYAGFGLRYYSAPFPEFEKSCESKGLTLTALPFKPKHLRVIKKPTDSFCTWVIRANDDNADHVIVFEIVSYSISPYPLQNCRVVTWVKDDMYIDQSYTSDVSKDLAVRCEGEFLKYYRSKNPAITVRLLDVANASLDMNISYYSIPRDESDNGDVLLIGDRPTYIWIDTDDLRFIKKLKTETGCIKLSMKYRAIFDSLPNYLGVYDGESSDDRELTNINVKKSISGTKQYMFIKAVNKTVINPYSSIKISRKKEILLVIHSTDKCTSVYKKLVISESLPFVTIPSSSFSRSSIYNYEISASRPDSVLSIRGVIKKLRDQACGNRVVFYNSDKRFYKWCILENFSMTTSFNKLQFTMYYDKKDIRYEIIVVETMKSQAPMTEQCNGTQNLYPKVGQKYKINVNHNKINPQNLDCAWLIRAPPGDEIGLTINSVELNASCIDLLELYNGDRYLNTDEIFGYCGKSAIDFYRPYISHGGVLLLHLLSYAVSGVKDLDITYSLVGNSQGNNIQILYATKDYQSVRTSNYPGYQFRGHGTYWYIRAASGRRVSFKIYYNDLGNGDIGDYVDITDDDMVRHEVLNTSKPVYFLSSTEGVYVKFHSEYPLTKSGGILIKYKSEYGRETGGGNSIMIGVMTTLCIGFVAFFIIIIICVRNKMKSHKSTTHATPATPATTNVNFRHRSLATLNPNVSVNTVLCPTPAPINELLPPPSYEQATSMGADNSFQVTPNHDELPSYENSLNAEHINSSMDEGDLTLFNGGLPRYEDSQQFEIPR